jgi:succinoglycan biosynthesis transport protein ExoP
MPDDFDISRRPFRASAPPVAGREGEPKSTPPLQQPLGAARAIARRTAQAGVLQLGDVLRRHWFMTSAVAIAAFLAATLVTFDLTPQYRAQTQIMIGTATPRSVEGNFTTLAIDAESVQSEIERVTSRDLLSKVVLDLGLQEISEFNTDLEPPSAPIRYLATLEQRLETRFPTGVAAGVVRVLGRGISLMEGSTPEPGGATSPDNVPAIIDRLASHLGVRSEGASRVITIAVTSEEPSRAAEIANKIAAVYLTSQLEAKYQATERASRWLNSRVTELRDQVDAAERRVEAFRQSAQLTGGRDSTPAVQQITELSTQVLQERSAMSQAQAQLDELERVRSTGNLDSLSEVLRSPTVQSLRTLETTASQRVADLKQSYGDRYPAVAQAQAQLAEIRRRETAEIDRIASSVRRQITLHRAQLDGLNREMASLTAERNREDSASVQLRALERDAAADRSLLDSLLARAKESDPQQSFQASDATVISHADVPPHPYFPRKSIILPVALLAALGLGGCAALLADRVGRGLRSADEIAPLLGVRAAGLLPRIAHAETAVIANPTSAFAEALRSMHTGLVIANGSPRPSVLLVTSALPGEGKSTIATALARLLAPTMRVVLIDCDLRRPRLHDATGTSRSPGLSNLLASKATLGEVIHTDRLSKASFIAAGDETTHPAALFAGPHMGRVLEALKLSYDLVILDTAPLLAVADTRLIAAAADQVVLVARWSKTRWDVAALALQLLHEAQANVAGVALNMVDTRKHARGAYSDSGLYRGAAKRYYAG